MSRRSIALGLACVSALTGACAPSLGGLAASSDRGGGRTTVVNPTLDLGTVSAFVGSSSLTITPTTTPAGLTVEGSIDGGAFARIGGSWNLTGLGDGSHTVRMRVAGAPSSERQTTFTVDTAAPTAPSGVSITSTAGKLLVRWTAGADGGSGLATYTVDYGTTSGAPNLQSITSAPATGLDVTGVSSCESYYVKVSCSDRAGNRSSYTTELACRANCGGDGTFTAAATTLGFGPSTIASGDFDGDGILDLAVDLDETLQILLGNGTAGHGDGTFTSGTTYATGSTIAEIAVADVDADRILDIVLINETQLRVYKGQGTDGRGNGTFAAFFATSSNISTPQALLVRDVDGDRIPDVLVGNWGTNRLVTFTGNGSGGRGDGTFAFLGHVATANSPGAIAAGDFNADGITDVAVAGQGGTDVLVTHLGNGSNGRGNGTFAAAQTWLLGGFVAGDVVVTDHNGDGIDDLVATLALANSVCFLAGSGSGGRGTGSFYLDEVVGVGTRPWGLVRDDFTGDGIVDYASFSYLQAGMSLVKANGEHGRGDGTFTSTIVGGAGARLFRGIVGDVDGNGSPDVVAADLDGGYLVLRSNGRTGRGDGSFAERAEDPWVIGDAWGVGIGDFDGNHVPDVLAASYQPATPGGNDFVTSFVNGEVLGLGTGELTVTGQTSCGTGPTAFAFGDFDRDHVLDAAVLASDLDGRTGGNRVDVLLGSGSNGVGNGTFNNSSQVSVGTQPRGIVAGDFDSNAIVDLAVTNLGSGTVTILLGNGSGGRGDGTFTAQSPISAGTNPFCIVAGDFDSNGITDLAVGNAVGNGTGAVRILLGQGTDGVGDGTFTAGQVITTSFMVTGLAVGDFDGDGILDLVGVQHRSSGSITTAGFVLFAGGGSGGRGDGTFTAGSEVAIGGNPQAIAAGDFDRDGALDLAVTRSDAAAVAILLGNTNLGRGDGTFGTPGSVTLSAVSLSLATADLDSDGILDLIAAGGERVTLRFGGGDY